MTARHSAAEARWMADAKCAGSTDHVWIAPPRDVTEDDKRAAKAECDVCPVKVQCLRWHEAETNFEGFAAGRTWVCRAPGQAPTKELGHAWYDRARSSWVALCVDCGRTRRVRVDRGPVDSRCRRCRAGDTVPCPDCGDVVPVLGLGMHRRNRHRGVA